MVVGVRLSVLALLCSGVAWADAGGAGGAGHGSPWFGLAAAVVNFGISAWIVWRWGWPVLRRGLIGYGDEARGGITRATEARAGAEAAAEEWRRRRAGLAAEKERLCSELVTRAGNQRARRLERARVTAERLEREGEVLAAQERARARDLVREELADRAVAEATARLREALGAREQERFLVRFLGEVVR